MFAAAGRVRPLSLVLALALRAAGIGEVAGNGESSPFSSSSTLFRKRPRKSGMGLRLAIASFLSQAEEKDDTITSSACSKRPPFISRGRQLDILKGTRVAGRKEVREEIALEMYAKRSSGSRQRFKLEQLSASTVRLLVQICCPLVKRQNMTDLLDKLLEGYDRRLRPEFGGSPVVIKADILIRSMGPISERDMIYSMDCYFRQLWTDKRLAFNVSVANVSLNIKMLERIWYPDTVFSNGQASYLHTITTPNKFFRINKDGSILYSQRLTIRARCRMQLEKFPMDIQRCPLHLTSFGYTIDDVLYKWRFGVENPVEIPLDMTLSQFDIVGTPAWNETKTFRDAFHSVLCVQFDLKRRMGFFLLQVYVPCCLLVVLSWVSFWIHREATADRISLGTTTVLSMTFLGLDNRTDLPKVSYCTALDLYVAMCFVFVSATLLQFAAVHYFTKFGSGENDQQLTDIEEEEELPEKEAEEELQTAAMSDGQPGPPNQRKSLWCACALLIWECLTGTRNYHYRNPPNKMMHVNSVSKIDKGSRVFFPLAFMVLNVIYWVWYLNR